ncbi:hypothetical protein J2T08_001100 [Neorhizobium galegae]|uniref:hypothetical protein n=1 Tax=Neorhizobium galegae TaxID=399 RepID=UPI002780177A|nr:hypothetical protein [Neorhizobium galegae]MDQ0133199.1 hypothetical protein [Neorhizobium galegae]
MTESKKPMAHDSLAIEDDAPDLTESPWAEKLVAMPVVRGRPGWQSRINDVPRAWLAKR